VLPRNTHDNADDSSSGDVRAYELYVADLQSLIAELLEKNQRMRQQLLGREAASDQPSSSPI
jgi:hypothetical protein